MSKPEFIIEDWAGNICFHGKSFLSFEDAWDFIAETLQDDEDSRQEYYVCEKAAV